jgi:hypothetical protein
LSICTSNSCGNAKLRNKITVESKQRSVRVRYFLIDIVKVLLANLSTSKVRLTSSWEVSVKLTLWFWSKANISCCDKVGICFGFLLGSIKRSV